jgi:hypothetical protein
MSTYYEEVDYTFLFYMMFALAVLFFGIYMLAEEEEAESSYVLLLVMGVFLIMALIFNKLVIRVDQGTLTVGFKIMKSSYKLEDIVSCEKKTTRWFHGSGAHASFRSRSYITGPGPALEIKTKNGKSCIFSTKKQDRVLEAIQPASSTHS